MRSSTRPAAIPPPLPSSRIGAILNETRPDPRRPRGPTAKAIWRGDLYRFDITDSELSEMTIGLIGYGHIGTKVTQAAASLRLPDPGRDPYVPAFAEDLADGVQQVDFDTLLSESDVVSLHARVTEETKGFLNAKRFAQMKTGRLFHQHRPRADGELRRPLPGAEIAARPRRHAGDLLAGAGAGGLRRCCSLTM